MKKKIIITVVAMLVIAATVALIVSLVRRNNDEPGDNQSFDPPEIGAYTMYQIMRGDVVSTYRFNATAALADDALGELVLDKNAELFIKRGETVKVGKPFYTLNGEEVDADFNLKVLDITNREDGIAVSYLNFEQMKLTASIPFDEYDIFTYEANIIVTSGRKQISTPVKEIGYVIHDGYFDLTLSTGSAMLLPGEEVECLLEIGVKENVLWTYSDCIFDDGDTKFVIVLDEERREIRKDIIVGEQFSFYSGGYMSTCYEIISGVYEGERPCVRNDDGVALWQ